ncbi:unnamed protein product [Nezara viridula]|uniref:Uncharacterized protein n=1 Tax=Nezara viridula TaxID=85310 RepID=A0A9P0HS17_NEZVI|nr:unnamed protein product [Nezara viridula]
MRLPYTGSDMAVINPFPFPYVVSLSLRKILLNRSIYRWRKRWVLVIRVAHVLSGGVLKWKTADMRRKPHLGRYSLRGSFERCRLRIKRSGRVFVVEDFNFLEKIDSRERRVSVGRRLSRRASKRSLGRLMILALALKSAQYQVIAVSRISIGRCSQSC